MTQRKPTGTNDELRKVHYAPGAMECAGPLILDNEGDRLKAYQKRDGLVADRDLLGLLAMWEALKRGVRDRPAAPELHYAPSVENEDGSTTLTLLTTGAEGETNLAALAGAVTRLINGRSGCGEDLAVFQGAQPLDGRIHAEPCPGCGRTVVWRPPLSHEEHARDQEQRKAAVQEAIG